jgi:amino acid adenylation domain-containing protein
MHRNILSLKLNKIMCPVQQDISRDAESVPIDPAAEQPLSFAQERLWFIDTLEPGNVAYSLPFALWLTGEMNGSAFKQSVNQVVQRHDVLRTTFPRDNGTPAQKITAATEFDLEEIDLRELPESQRKAEAEKLIWAEARLPFDLERGPLLRMKLLRMGDRQHVLIGNMHHIISDGWSIAVMLRQISHFYAAHVKGAVADLPEMKLQYADFALWQRQWQEKGATEKQLEYWKTQLEGTPLLDLPIDRPRPAVRSHQGASLTFCLPGVLTSELRELSKKERVTLFMTLLAGFQVMLSKYAGQQDITVGTAIAGRNRKEFRDLIGFLANTVVLRTDLGGAPDFREVLKRVQAVALNAYRNQDVPFDRLVQKVQAERDLSRTPLFQVMLLMQSMDEAQLLQMPGLQVDEFVPLSPAAKFDLTLQIIEGPAGIKGDLSYASEIYTAETCERMMQHFQQLLEELVKKPDVPVTELSLLMKSERQQLLREWNSTESVYPEKCLPQLFAEQAERTPNAVAAEFENQELTYDALNQQANQLSRYLIKLGAGPETLVGICLERNLNMLVCLLGILKTGAAYVPLDPSYPADRLRYMIEDSGSVLLLTQEKLQHLWPAFPGRLVVLEHEEPEIRQESATDPPQTTVLENLSYVIYTSGSTGKPKGVQVTHGALTNFLFSMRNQPGITAEDVLLAVTPISFDIAGLELYLPLIVGARVRIISRAASVDGMRLAAELASSVTMMQATPASWQIAIESGWQGTQNLKVLCGGEALAADLAGKLISRSAAVWNMYGPTETAIWSLVEKLESAADGISIGRPIRNTRVYVLDESMQPVPVGVRGELYIGGQGLARGYWSRPDLTAERFVPDPFSKIAGERIYRTGDVVHWGTAGKLEFIGRADHQVKLRGHRIELGEIEAALTEWKDVAQAVVIIHEETPGEKLLVAYVVPTRSGGAKIVRDELRGFLKEKLPAYMVPSEIVVLDALPLGPSGKVNRRALPAPGVSCSLANKQFAGPSNELEKKISAIWRDVLHLDQFGMDDNFFDIGGNSLRSVRVQNQLMRSLDLKIEIVDLFKFPTVRALAHHLNSNTDGNVALERLQPVMLNAGKERLKRQLANRRTQ